MEHFAIELGPVVQVPLKGGSVSGSTTPSSSIHMESPKSKPKSNANSPKKGSKNYVSPLVEKLFDMCSSLRISLDRLFLEMTSRSTNNNDGIDYDSFLQGLKGLNFDADLEDIQDLWNEIDADGDGDLTILEIKTFCSNKMGPYQELKDQRILEMRNSMVRKDEDEIKSKMQKKVILLVAHNEMKPILMDFIRDRLDILQYCRIGATGSTGTTLETKFGLECQYKTASGPLGGDAQCSALIMEGTVGAVFFFRDPLTPQPHIVDCDCLVNVCNFAGVPLGGNPGSAEVFFNAIANYGTSLVYELFQKFYLPASEKSPKSVSYSLYPHSGNALNVYKNQQMKENIFFQVSRIFWYTWEQMIDISIDKSTGIHRSMLTADFFSNIPSISLVRFLEDSLSSDFLRKSLVWQTICQDVGGASSEDGSDQFNNRTEIVTTNMLFGTFGASAKNGDTRSDDKPVALTFIQKQLFDFVVHELKLIKDNEGTTIKRCDFFKKDRHMSDNTQAISNMASDDNVIVRDSETMNTTEANKQGLNKQENPYIVFLTEKNRASTAGDIIMSYINLFEGYTLTIPSYVYDLIKSSYTKYLSNHKAQRKSQNGSDEGSGSGPARLAVLEGSFVECCQHTAAIMTRRNIAAIVRFTPPKGLNEDDFQNMGIPSVFVDACLRIADVRQICICKNVVEFLCLLVTLETDMKKGGQWRNSILNNDQKSARVSSYLTDQKSAINSAVKK